MGPSPRLIAAGGQHTTRGFHCQRTAATTATRKGKGGGSCATPGGSQRTSRRHVVEGLRKDGLRKLLRWLVLGGQGAPQIRLAQQRLCENLLLRRGGGRLSAGK